ncbi:MAG TPA: DUF4142 domain-containing protein [Burkholderiaceae bacterium]|nr:DUF4142 domain-containing protein [Burkholderiaceae bacterium]
MLTSSRALIAATVMALPWLVHAQPVVKADRDTVKFVEKAGVAGATEVALGQLAQRKGTSSDVKTFAAQMVEDHTKAGDELKTIATSKGITAPAGPDKSASRDIEKMSRLEGADFDRAYAKQMVSDHRKTVSLFEKEAKSGKDAEMKAFASKTLPTLQHHHEMAKTMNEAVRK